MAEPGSLKLCNWYTRPTFTEWEGDFCLTSANVTCLLEAVKVLLPVDIVYVMSCPCFCILMAFPGGASGKEPACQSRRHKRWGFNPWVGKIPWRRTRQPTPVFLLGESHGQRSLAGYSVRLHRVRNHWSDLAWEDTRSYERFDSWFRALPIMVFSGPCCWCFGKSDMIEVDITISVLYK